MKLALIGANGNVGAELCFLLKNDVDLKPITRNRLGSIFLNYHGFDCTISDISKDTDAKDSLSDVDVVVISSYATDVFTGSQTRSSQLINEKIIKNSVNFSPSHAIIIYFSTIRAFSNKIDPNTPKGWTKSGYDKEKNTLEKILFSESTKTKKKAYALRLGHVYGDNQPRTRDLKKILSNPQISFQVKPETKSNVVHTVTIKDAILNCLESKTSPGTYSLVNVPQWTWKNVIDYYKNPQTIVNYKSTKILPQENSTIWNFLKSNKKYLAPLRYYISPKYDTRINKKLSTKRMLAAIASLKTETPLHMSLFDYNPIPGPFLQNLKNTKNLLESYNLKVF
tara:strand:- start:2695 stop:3708 length:1014 start_codon:yes stop_codon:yes gene_type:complete